MSASNPAPWGSSFRLIASEKWKAKSAVMGKAVTEALVEYSRPLPGMRVLDLASGTGEPESAWRSAFRGSVGSGPEFRTARVAAERARDKNSQTS